VTNDEINDGAAALEAYAEGQSWKAYLAPKGTWHEGSIDIIKAADGSKDQSPAGRQTAAVGALHVALRSVGHESEMTAQQYHDGAAVVLAAVNKRRIRNMSKDGPKPTVASNVGQPPGAKSAV
jgi:hypothetical protein